MAAWRRPVDAHPREQGESWPGPFETGSFETDSFETGRRRVDGFDQVYFEKYLALLSKGG
ncbi:MAG: hypothetical protein ACON31_02075 [Candidatus Puniceispirillaceae bacterium]